MGHLFFTCRGPGESAMTSDRPEHGRRGSTERSPHMRTFWISVSCLPKVVNFIHKPLLKVTTLRQLRRGVVRGGVPSAFSQREPCMNLFSELGAVAEIRRTTLEWIFRAPLSYSRCKKQCVFELRGARTAIHSHGEQGEERNCPIHSHLFEARS